MKTSVIVLFLVILTFAEANGQWYYTKYQVNDIHALSTQQLDESLQNSRQNFLASGCVTGLGGLFFVLGYYVKPGMSDDPDFFEQLLGDKGVNFLIMGLGVCMVAGGAVATIVFATRSGRIKAVLNERPPSGAFASLRPSLYYSPNSTGITPGLTLRFTF
ncbi:MAG: hypothetical protein U0X39_03295 [Bacteroidales bacterium]